MNNSSQHNQKEPYRVAYLIAGFVRQSLTEQEHDELDEWINESDDNMKLFEDLTDAQNIEENLAFMDKVQQEKNFQQLLTRIPEQRSARIRTIWRIGIAAASIVAITVSILLLTMNKHDNGSSTPLAVSDTSRLQPGGNRATLKTGNGNIIDLLSARDGAIIEGVTKEEDGKLIYEESDKMQPVQWHTLTTPSGGQYQVKLPDGTIAWLNAETSLTYPTRFIGNERTIELSGEAYFEVFKNNQQPFRVNMDDSCIVNVLGTHFNIKSYGDEKAKLITLLEGSVEVNAYSNTEKLMPGMQARIEGHSLLKINNVDTEEAIGWKDGLFVFHDDSIEEIMQQVKRWYDAKIIIQGKINQQFNATIKRSEPLSKLLHVLELNGYVKFKTENQIIYVLPR